MTRTMTRAQLSESIYQEVGLSRNESAELLEMVLAEISTALVHSETVKISSFGSFSVRQKGERIGRNPKTGDEVPILPRKVLVFRPSQLLKARIRGEDVSGMTDEDEDVPAPQKPPVGPAGFSSSET